MWITGTYLHWRNGSNTQFRFLGTSIATPVGAVVGSLWTEANNVHYIDSVGAERQVAGSFIATQAPAGALAGSMWFDTAYAPSTSAGQLHFIGAAQHEHWAHTDTAFNNAHTDTAFSNAHTNIAFNNAHTNAHTDIAFNNAHTNAHTNIAFSNSHSNAHTSIGFGNSHSN